MPSIPACFPTADTRFAWSPPTRLPTSPNEALTGWKDSAHFEMDTTPPGIANLHAALEGDRLHVSFSAADSFSIIQRAEYSIDAGDWQFVAPVGEISDSKTENYDFSAPVTRAA